MPQLIRRLLPIILVFASVFIAYKLLNSPPKVSQKNNKTIPRLSVETTVLGLSQFNVEIESFGTIQARTQTDLFPLISGMVVGVSAQFKSGAFFKKNDILLTVDSADYDIAVQVAKGDVINAELALAEEEARYAQAQRDWKKQKQQTLATDFALRLPQMRAAKAKLETAKAQLNLAMLNADRTEIRAQYDGRILKTFVDIGSVVSSNVRLAQMYSTHTVEIRLPISSKDLHFIDLPDQDAARRSKLVFPAVRIENALTTPTEYWKGPVVRTEAAIDPQSQQLYVVAQIDDPFLEKNTKKEGNGPSYPLKIGQYVRAKVSGKVINDAIVIPNSTIYQGSYVYIVKDQKLYRQEIDIAWRNQNESIIKEGLKEGDHLVMTLLGQVTSGTSLTENIIDPKETLLSSEVQP